MHVREIPDLVFDQFADPDQQEAVTNEHLRPENPGTQEQRLRDECGDWDDTIRRVGSTKEGFGMRIRDAESQATKLEIFHGLRSAILDDDSPVSIVAGSRETGAWRADKGNETEQTVWVETRRSHSDDMKRAAAFFEFVGRVIQLTGEMSRDSQFEHSKFYEGDINP